MTRSWLPALAASIACGLVCGGVTAVVWPGPVFGPAIEPPGPGFTYTPFTRAPRPPHPRSAYYPPGYPMDRVPSPGR